MAIRAEIPILKHQNEYATSQDRYTAMVGGFGSGKSQASVFRTLCKLRDREWCVMLQVAPTYSLLADVNIPDYEAFFNKYHIKYVYEATQRRMVVNQGGLRGEIWFRSADKPERIVGFDVTDFQIDEYDTLPTQKQRELWRKIIARARGCESATGGVTTTPEGYRETYELFEKKSIGRLIRAKTTDNIYLPKDYIETLFDQYDEMLVKQYINGEFVNINGMPAYYGFSRETCAMGNDKFQEMHGLKLADLTEVCIGMDFNVKKMCAEVFCHLRDKKRMHFFDEIVIQHPGHSDRTTTEIMCGIIKDKFHGKRINVYPDPSSRQRRTSAPASDLAILEKAGFYVYVPTDNYPVRDRLNSANTMFGKRLATVDPVRCPELVEDLEKCERDKYGEVDKRDEQRTHASDAGTYPMAYLYPVTWRMPVKEIAI